MVHVRAGDGGRRGVGETSRRHVTCNSYRTLSHNVTFAILVSRDTGAMLLSQINPEGVSPFFLMY